jgi:hypothetical protein
MGRLRWEQIAAVALGIGDDDGTVKELNNSALYTELVK